MSANWSYSDPAAYATEITTSDATDQGVFRGFMVGASGNVKVTTVGGSTVTFTGVAAGIVIPIRVKRFWATGTTATSIVAVS